MATMSFMAFDSRLQRELPMPEVHKACEGANFSAIFVDAHRDHPVAAGHRVAVAFAHDAHVLDATR
jgi:hypothetical protein